MNPLYPPIVLIQVPYFSIHNSEGGAEAIALTLAIELSKIFTIFIIHGGDERDINNSAFLQEIERVHVIRGIQLQPADRISGILNFDQFTDVAKSVISSSRLVVVFERALSSIPEGISFISVLGGVAYQHCLDVIKCSTWRKLVVPSDFVKSYASENLSDSTRKKDVVVISNGIDLELFESLNIVVKRETKRSILRLLLPARPDWQKGYPEALEFCKKLKEWEIGFVLIITELKNEFTPFRFYENFIDQAHKSNIDVIVEKWLPRKAMPKIYQSSDLTLSIGAIPEGFGLVAIESIYCGTPVVAKAAGASLTLLPTGCGLTFLHTITCRERLQSILNDATTNCNEGKRFITENYSSKLMVEKFTQLILQLI